MVTWHQPSSLQRGCNHQGIVVNLTPRHEPISLGGLHTVTNEAHASRSCAGVDEPLDDRIGMMHVWNGNRCRSFIQRRTKSRCPATTCCLLVDSRPYE